MHVCRYRKPKVLWIEGYHSCVPEHVMWPLKGSIQGSGTVNLNSHDKLQNWGNSFPAISLFDKNPCGHNTKGIRTEEQAKELPL